MGIQPPHICTGQPDTLYGMLRAALLATVWISVYLAFTLTPLALLLISPVPPSRGFWIEFSAALGFVGFAMMVVQFALTARFKPFGAPFGMDTILQFHRQAGIIAVLLVLAHPVVAIIANPRFIEFYDPRINAPRAAALSIVTVALVLLILLTLRRRSFGISYERWRLIHGVLGMLVVTIGLGHIMMVGYSLTTLWKQAVWVLATGAAFYLLLHVRVFKPMVMERRPYRVTNVREERGNCTTLTFAPDGHEGMRFEPGQFAWLTLGETPYTLQQHPFSFSSSAATPRHLEMTIKNLGDFTSTIRDVKPGTKAFLEGPYGGFIADSSAPGVVIVAGGVGITPGISILRTARDKSDTRPFLLIYGTRDIDHTPFREQLEQLASEINLKVIHVLEQPAEPWSGERGFITHDLLKKYLHETSIQTFHFLVCGPEVMMDAVETSLLHMGVAAHRLKSERFSIV
ncbi:MAG TPA: ferric reductase-like transmembrane domain-containing protein [Phycisphaerales bacterium]|nr:ferric reductase-like transmembrane domain-containing protein [Phycisphaerales bacterium]